MGVSTKKQPLGAELQFAMWTKRCDNEASAAMGVPSVGISHTQQARAGEEESWKLKARQEDQAEEHISCLLGQLRGNLKPVQVSQQGPVEPESRSLVA